MNMQEQVSTRHLREVDIFAGLADHELEQIAKICRRRAYQADECCAVQGETTDELGIVNEGKVAIEIRLEVVPYTQTLSVTNLTRGRVMTSMFGPYLIAVC